jgi:hypothetical protein
MAGIDSANEIQFRLVKDGKSPGYWHYPGDFERDMAGTSLAAQGLWIRMLGWMHQNEAHRGFLELPNGEAMTDQQICLRVGRSVREVRPLLQELKSFSVFSVAPSGALYCRRMARETHISEVRRSAAKSRADRADRAVDGSFARSFAPMVDGTLNQQNRQLSEGKIPTVTDSVSDSVSDSSITTLCSSDDERGGGVLELVPPQLAPKPIDEVKVWFDGEFWPVYPRKTAKPQALKAARLHGKTAAVRATIMECLLQRLPALQAQFRTDGDYRPYPASWLNQSPWLDPEETARPASKPAGGGMVTGGIEAAMRLLDEEKHS